MKTNLILRGHLSPHLLRLINIPNTDQIVITPGQQMTLLVLIPAKPEPQVLVPGQLQLTIHLLVDRLRGMHGVVENQHLPGIRLGRQNVVLLGHVAGLVHLPFVQDAGLHLHAVPGRIFLLFFVLVLVFDQPEVLGVFDVLVLRQLHLRDHQVVGLRTGGLGAHQQLVPGEIGVVGGLMRRQPLDGEAGPLEEVSYDSVVQQRGVLLPDLEFVVDLLVLVVLVQF